MNGTVGSKRNFDTIFTRILLGVLVVILSETFLFFGFQRYFQTNFINRIFENKGKHMVENLAVSCVTALYLEDEKLLRDPVDAILADDFVLAVGIYDETGNARLLTGVQDKATYSALLPDRLDSQTMNKLRDNEYLSIRVAHAHIFMCPIRINPSIQWMLKTFNDVANNNKTIGYAAMAISMDLLNRYLDSVRLYTVFAGITALIVGLLVAVFVARMLSAPMKKLSQKAKFSQIIHEKIDFAVGGPKELRELSNAMEAFLRARHFFEKALTTERKRLKNLLESIPDPLYVIEEDHRLVFTNRAFNRRFGPPGKLPCYEHIHHRKNPCPWCPLKYKKNTDKDTVFTFLHKRTSTFFEAFCSTFSSNASTSSWLFVLKDVTSWKLNQQTLERELRENEVLNELSRLLLAVRDDPARVVNLVLARALELTRSKAGFVGIVDPEKNVLEIAKVSVVDPQGGLSTDKAISIELKDGADYKGLLGYAFKIKDGFFVNEPQKHPASIGVPQGHIKVNNFMAAPAMIGDTPYGIIAVANSKSGAYSPRDLKSLERITDIYALALNSVREAQEKERLWKELREAQKMEAIATLAGGIAHDFNNILAPIMGFAEILLMRRGNDQEIRSGLQRILDSAVRAKEIVAQILAFSRSKEGEKKLVAVTSIVKETVTLLNSTLPKTITLETDIQQDVPPIMADPVHIHQIVMNLCTNAYHAMEEDGGTLKVTVDEMTRDGKRFVRITVSDTGHGIPDEYMERIFEPYFSTKDVDKGTGLGLAMVHGIVESYNGSVEVRSRVGEGTTFEIYLPAATDHHYSKTAEPEGRPTPEPPPKLKGNVLVVDDEEQVRQVLEGLLDEFGLKVTTASSAKEALRIIERSQGTFDLIFTDQTMPEITGVVFIETLRQRGVSTPVILCTGYNSRVDEESARRLSISDIMLKPVDTRTLYKALKKVLVQH